MEFLALSQLIKNNRTLTTVKLEQVMNMTIEPNFELLKNEAKKARGLRNNSIPIIDPNTNQEVLPEVISFLSILISHKLLKIFTTPSSSNVKISIIDFGAGNYKVGLF